MLIAPDVSAYATIVGSIDDSKSCGIVILLHPTTSKYFSITQVLIAAHDLSKREMAHPMARSSGVDPSKEAKITVTSQQSRFSTDASTTPPSKELIIKDLTITIGQRELLSHAELNLQPGRHYVLVGRNGVGKSTLLKAIDTGLVPGIPQSLRVLLLGQVQGNGDEPISDLKRTVLQHVVQSDGLRERLLHEAHQLLEASEDSTDPFAIIKVYRDLMHTRLQQRTEHASVIAARQSGVRGLKARKELQKLEQELHQSTTALSAMDLSDAAETNATELASETQMAFDMLNEVHSMLDSMNASAAEAKARSVLLGLGFSADSLDRPFDQLSGGWRTRCSLACALCQSADLLLLDEPTNFLDLPSIIWLENYIRNLGNETTVIVVTHDRAFADGVAEELLVLRNLVIEKFRGNVSTYESEKIKTFKHMSRVAESQEKQKKHIQATIASNVKAAKRAGDDKKLKQAASRQKKLDERMGMQVSSKGTRFKLNRDLAGYHDNRRNDIEVPTFDPPTRLHVPLSPSDLRFPGALLMFEDVVFSYPGARKPTLNGINLVIHPKDRVGLAGLNGSGKSTFVNLAMASAAGERKSSPSKGTITMHPRAKIGLYSQAATENLTVLGSAEPGLTALKHLMAFAGQDMEEKDARGLLSALGLPPKSQSDVPISLLSGGQKVRLALAKVLWDPPHLLILDEVTTHLDSDTIQALAIELRKYEGALLVITHDRFFMRCVVEGESLASMARQARADLQDDADGESSSDEDESAASGVVYRLSKGVLIKLESGMQQYEERAAKSSAKLGKA